MLLALVACSVTVSGCASSFENDEPAPESPVITLNGQANAWPTADVTGRLTKREGCLLIGTNVAVFPHGTGWRDPNVVFGDGTTVAVGTRVRLGGGYFDADAATQDELPIVPVSRVQDCARRTGVEGFVWAMP